MKGKSKKRSPELNKAYITQPISQADSRQEKTGVAMPNDVNVARNRDWVEENEK